jgi:HAMP domain-containing protein
LTTRQKNEIGLLTKALDRLRISLFEAMKRLDNRSQG